MWEILMNEFPGHELRADGNVVPKRPTMADADFHPQVWMEWMQQWAETTQMKNRVAPADNFLWNVNEEMRMDELFGVEPQMMTLDEILRRLRGENA